MYEHPYWVFPELPPMHWEDQMRAWLHVNGRDRIVWSGVEGEPYVTAALSQTGWTVTGEFDTLEDAKAFLPADNHL